MVEEITIFDEKLLENYSERDVSPPFETISEFLSYGQVNEYADSTSFFLSFTFFFKKKTSIF